VVPVYQRQTANPYLSYLLINNIGIAFWTAFSAYLGPDLLVCLPNEKHLDGLEVAIERSTEERGRSILTEIYRDNKQDFF
jgi:hypothetical protein